MLTSYGALQASVADWLNRRDLTAQIKDFVTLAEASISRRVRRKTIRTTVTLTQDTFTLPPDCAELRSVRLVSGSPSRDLPFKIVTPEVLAEIRALFNNVAQRPRWGTVTGNTLTVVPPPDSAYTAELSYFEKLVPLTDPNQTNSILQESPDVYLYGALSHSAPFLQHDERIPIWQGAFEKALAELEAVREREEFSASIRPARLPMRF